MNWPLYFDRDGHPLTMEEWAKLLGNAEHKRVAWDALPNGGHLSTVWLGLNHAHGPGLPLIFETMAFPMERYEWSQERYSSLEEAKAGHARILAELAARRTQEGKP